MSKHDQDLIDALRTWHQLEHGDHTGAMQSARGRQFPPEWADLFEAQSHAAECWNLVEQSVAETGYHSDEFESSAHLWMEATAHVNALLDELSQQAAAAPAPQQRGGPPAPRQAASAAQQQQRGGPPPQQARGKVGPVNAAGLAAMSALQSVAGSSTGSAFGSSPSGGSIGGRTQADASLPAMGQPFSLAGVAGLP